MSKKILATLAFALTALQVGSAAQAEAKTWYFNYQGFQHQAFVGREWDTPAPFVWEANASFGGQFVAEDRNRDSVISRDEVSSFVLRGFDYGTCRSEHFYVCGIERFHFSSAGLNFKVVENYNDGDGAVFTNSSFDSNRGWKREHWNWAWVDSDIYKKTADTTFTISAPVPEPETYLMFGAGLLGLAALRRLRK